MLVRVYKWYEDDKWFCGFDMPDGGPDHVDVVELPDGFRVITDENNVQHVVDECEEEWRIAFRKQPRSISQRSAREFVIYESDARIGVETVNW